MVDCCVSGFVRACVCCFVGVFVMGNMSTHSSVVGTPVIVPVMENDVLETFEMFVTRTWFFFGANRFQSVRNGDEIISTTVFLFKEENGWNQVTLKTVRKCETLNPEEHGGRILCERNSGKGSLLFLTRKKICLF